MGNYRTFGTALDRVFRNDLNNNFSDIANDINAQKTRVDNLITGTPQPSEVVDARGGKTVLKDRLDAVDVSLAERAKYLQYDVFPDVNTINGLSDNTTFTTKGYYTKGDGFGCAYTSFTSWKANSIQIGTRYVVPIDQPIGEIFLPYYGIRTGSAYAVSNSTIMTSILANVSFASLLKAPSGHFYFNTTIDLGSGNKQLKLTGAAPVGYTLDVNAYGLTWFHFPNLTNGQTGIACTSATISNIIFYGNPSTYNLSIDRSKTVVAPDQIVTETTTATTYGINQTAGSVDIQNCAFYYFYYGINCITSNNTIDNVFGRYCHYLVSIGGDTKVSRIFAFYVMVALQIRASISSAITVRGDSIGQHLVQITNGNKIHLSDLDADYCLKSILHLGDGINYVNIFNLYVNGMHGRCNVYRAYDSSTTSEPTSANITTTANVEEYPIISVAQKTHFFGGRIVLISKGNSNPTDGGNANYLTPSILIAADIASDVHNVEMSIIDNLGSTDTTPLTPTWLSNRVKTLSGNGRSLEIAVKTAFDTLFYIQNGQSAPTFTKLVPQATS